MADLATNGRPRPDDPSAGAFADFAPSRQAAFARYRFTPHTSGLMVPSATLAEVADEFERVQKAGQASQALERKMGALLSAYYSVFANMVQYGAAEKPRGTPTHKLLRAAASQSLVDSLLINARLHQMRYVSRRVVVEGREKGWRVVHFKASDPNFKVTPDIQRRCLEMENLIESPNPQVHASGIKDLYVRAVQGELEIDRKVLIMLKGQDGRPRAFHSLPPDGIKPRYEVVLGLMARQGLGLRTEQDVVRHVYDRHGVDISGAAYVQVLDDLQVYGAWDADEIAVDITNPSDQIDRWGYGTSSLERSLEATTFLLRAFEFNKNIFTSKFPEAFLTIEGKTNQEGLEAFKKMIYAEVGEGGNQRLPVFATGESTTGVPNKAQLLKVRDSLRDMTFPQLVRMMIALKCSAYRAHPSLLNFAPDSGGQRPLLSNETQEEQIALAQEEGLHSLLSNLADWLTRALIKPWYDDLRLIFTVQDSPKDIEELQVWTMRTAVGHTVNEYRATQGLKPLEEITGVDGNYVNSPMFFQQRQMAMMEQQAAQQAAMGQLYGEPGGFEGMAAPASAQPAPRNGHGGNGGNGHGRPTRPRTGAAERRPTRKSLTITIER